MNMSDSWLDRLSALRSTMPDAPAEDAAAEPAEEAAAPAQKGRLDIVFERKGRAGKCATIITGFTLDDDAVAALASELKRKLGAGGSARGGEILVQGDRRNDVLRFLTERGYKARII